METLPAFKAKIVREKLGKTISVEIECPGVHVDSPEAAKQTILELCAAISKVR